MYQKEIIYMGLYKDGSRIGNAGFLKVENWESESSLDLKLKNIPFNIRGRFPIRIHNGNDWKEINGISVQEGGGSWKETMTDNAWKVQIQIMLPGGYFLEGQSKAVSRASAGMNTDSGKVESPFDKETRPDSVFDKNGTAVRAGYDTQDDMYGNMLQNIQKGMYNPQEALKTEAPHNIPEEIRGEVSHGMPEEIRGEVSHSIPEETRGEVSHGVPEETRGEVSHGMPEETRGEVSHGMPEETRREVLYNMPEETGTGASRSAQKDTVSKMTFGVQRAIQAEEPHNMRADIRGGEPHNMQADIRTEKLHSMQENTGSEKPYGMPDCVGTQILSDIQEGTGTEAPPDRPLYGVQKGMITGKPGISVIGQEECGRRKNIPGNDKKTYTQTRIRRNTGSIMITEDMRHSATNEPSRRRDSVVEYPAAYGLKEDKWEQILDSYEKIHPYGDERVYVKLEPKDFIILQSKYQHLVNNSFLLHGFYNYRYVILGKENDYYLGVPGVFYEREKMVALMFGFEAFECPGGIARAGEFGYYLRKVEL